MMKHVGVAFLPLFLGLLGNSLGGSRSAQVELTGPLEPKRWVLVTPIDPGRKVAVFEVKEGERRVELAGVEPGAALVCAGAEKGAAVCERRQMTAGEVIFLPAPGKGVAVTGRVLLGRNVAAGAEIRVVPEPLPLRRRFSLPLFLDEDSLETHVLAGDAGRFFLPGLVPGTYRLDMRLPGGRLDTSEPFTVPAPPPPRNGHESPFKPFDLGDVTLAEGVPLAILALDSTGQPVPRASVGAMQPGGGGRTVFFEGTTDKQGAYNLTGLDSAQPVTVTCLAPGFLPFERPFDAPPGAVRCNLERFVRLSGKLIDDEGRPLAGGTVRLRPAGARQTTAADGSFHFPEMASGTLELTAQAPGFRAVTRSFQLSPEERRELGELELLPSPELYGKVVDGQTGRPIPLATLNVSDPPGGATATTDEEGKFALAASSPGSLFVEAEAPGYPKTTIEVNAAEQEAGQPLTWRLLPGGRLRVTVWNEESDAPCLGCGVILQGGGRLARLATGADGSALSELLAPGRYDLTREAVASTGSVVTVRGGDDRRIVQVEPGRTVEARFGEPSVPTELFLNPPPSRAALLVVDREDGSERFDPRSDGSYRFKRRKGQAVRLSRLAPEGMAVFLTELPGSFTEPVVHFEIPDTAVRGRVERNGDPWAGTPLRIVSVADGTIAAWGQSATDGSFFAEGLRPGAYRVFIAGRPAALFDLGPGSLLELESLRLDISETPNAVRGVQ